jgi:hypothetical protein
MSLIEAQRPQQREGKNKNDESIQVENLVTRKVKL